MGKQEWDSRRGESESLSLLLLHIANHCVTCLQTKGVKLGESATMFQSVCVCVVLVGELCLAGVKAIANVAGSVCVCFCFCFLQYVCVLNI